MSAMTDTRIGVIADDLTGAADIGGILTRAGVATTLFVGQPQGPAPASQALVLALKSRSIPAEDAVRQSLQALDWLRAAGATVILFKICSTFDSTPDGNIGPVAEALLDATAAPGAVVCPAFPANGRTVYQGHLFVRDRLLSESGMERHPLNPMTDPDLRRWLGRQTKGAVGHLSLGDLRAGQAATRLTASFAAGQRLVVCDAIDDEDLCRLGVAVSGHPLVVGGSAIAGGIVAALPMRDLPGVTGAPRRMAGKGCILSGSCSEATLEQVANHSRLHPVLCLDPENLSSETALGFLTDHAADRPLVTTSAPPGVVADLQARLGRDRLAARIDAFFSDLSRRAAQAGFDAIVVAGGETSGAVASAFAPLSCLVGSEIAPGVPTLYPDDPMAPAGLVLKSGNFGGPDFFDRALDALEAGR
jgi:uncharacterized protein YgbK (DUF1537 family)